MFNKKVISLYGGPGIGKSTFASMFYYLMKKNQYSVELISEFVKDWAYEGRIPQSYEQIYILSNQCRREYSLFKHVDYIITDSGVDLALIYASIYNASEDELECFKSILKVHYNHSKTMGFEHINILLKRSNVFKYQQSGRFSTEEHAHKVDLIIKKYLDENNIKYIEIEVSDNIEKDGIKLMELLGLNNC